MLGLGLAFEKLSQNIPWNFLFSEAIRKRAIRYLLHRYVGQFLLENLSLDQLTVDLSSGTGIIKDLALDIHALNEVAEQLNLPFKFIDGYIGEIFVNIPWRNLLSENCFVGVTGLKLVVHPKQRDSDISLVDSMIDSMTSSMQIAQECLSQVTEEGAESEYYFDEIDSKDSAHDPNSIDAIEHFARAIDTILNKIKVRFTDLIIQCKYEPKLSYSSIGLEIKIDNIDYFDEAGLGSDKNENAFIESTTFTSKKLLIEGISVYTCEIPNHCKESYSTEKLNESMRDKDGLKKSVNSKNDCNSIDSNKIEQDEMVTKISKNSILIAKLYNRQELKIKLKKNDSVSGPKVQFEANCGSLIMFLSPRQVHLLHEIFNGISSPEINMYEDKFLYKDKYQKPMTKSDFQKIECDLIEHISPRNPLPCQALNLKDGWSSPPSISLRNEDFHPIQSPKDLFKNSSNPMTSSINTDISDMDKSFVSTTTINACEMKSDMQTSFKIRLSALGLIILHEDVMVVSSDPSLILMPSSVNEMQKKSESFFDTLNNMATTENCFNEYIKLQNKLREQCKQSHLRFIVTSLIVEGNEISSINKNENNLNINGGWCELIECIYENSNSEEMIENKILLFKEMNTAQTSSPIYKPMKPKIKVSLKNSKSMQPHGNSFRLIDSRVEAQIFLDECWTEFDISIIDRINNLLNKPDIIIKRDDKLLVEQLPNSHLDNQAFFKDIMDDVSSKSDSNINIQLKCSNFHIKICFPIPDLKPLSDMTRVPRWKRNVRSDVLLIHAEDFYCESSLNLGTFSTYEILCNDIHLLFQEKENMSPISLLRASHAKDIEKGFNPIRLLIKNYPSRVYSDLEDEPIVSNESIMTKSMMGFLEEVDENVADLFNKRKMASHNIINNLTIPADQEEINKFINDTLKNVQYDIDICLSDVQLILPNKHIFEIVYNRLVSDMLLWEPSAPKNYKTDLCSSAGNTESSFLISSDRFTSRVQPFKPFPSRYESQDTEQSSVFQSVYEHETQNMKKANDIKENKNKQTLLGLKIKIHNGIASVHTPYRDVNNVIDPNKHGTTMLTFDRGILFIASGYKGNIDSCQGSICLSKLNVYHNPSVALSSTPIILSSEFKMKPVNIEPVLYQSEKLCRMGGGNSAFSSKDSVILCFKTLLNNQKNEKHFELSTNLYGLTMRYFMTNSSDNWLCQLSDFFNVEDYPVPGFSWPDVLTELNCHFEHCSIDYRPLNLPLRSYIVVDSLALSSNLTIKGNSSILLLIIEDAGLFLSQNVTSKKVNLKENYVCVADLGVFELCIKLDTDVVEYPLKELLFSNNVIHIRTCADSFKALLEFIIYLANEGDLIQEADDSTVRCTNSEIKPNTLSVSSIPKKEKADCHDIVEYMMQEAMIESDLKDEASESSLNNIPEDNVFLFPDEGAAKTEATVSDRMRLDSCGSVESALREAQEEVASHNLVEEVKQGTDDEYCILDDIPGTGIRSPSGKPKARHIKVEYVTIKEGHFDPLSDQLIEPRLNAPKHFPKPIMKYNLQELSLTWHIYGGSDFDKTNTSNFDRKTQHISSNTKGMKSPQNEVKFNRNTKVTFSKDDAAIVQEDSVPFMKHAVCSKWFAVGGSNRCHESLMEVQLSKIRFNYEIYPDKCPFESHYLLTVNDIEIRDRLSSSKINKFLYQFCSESSPRQASANMIQVKAVAQRNEPHFNSSETSLNIAVRPIRLNVDQDALIFLTEFAMSVITENSGIDYGEEEKTQCALSQSPIMTVNYEMGNDSDINVEIDDQINSNNKECGSYSPVYFKNVIFSPDVPIRIDYHGKHIDMNSQYGALAGLVIGLGQLNHSEITLKRIELRTGVLGVDKLMNSLSNEWITDIRKNQLPSLLGGVGPMHSFVKLFQGIRDFVWLPIEQYHKDGRVFRGLQRGTSAFTTSSAYAILDLTGRFIGCIQSTAETMYDIVSPGPSVKNKPYRAKKGQPKDIREGVSTAYGLVKSGLGDTASSILKVATEEHSHKGVSGVVGGVLRQIPPAVVQPIILASEATCTVIGGMTNQLVPDARKEAVEKWKV